MYPRPRFFLCSGARMEGSGDRDERMFLRTV